MLNNNETLKVFAAAGCVVFELILHPVKNEVVQYNEVLNFYLHKITAEAITAARFPAMQFEVLIQFMQLQMLKESKQYEKI